MRKTSIILEIAKKAKASRAAVYAALNGTKPSTIGVRPQRLEKRIYNVTAAVDTAKEHREFSTMTIDLAKEDGLHIRSLPAYSMAVFRFGAKKL